MRIEKTKDIDITNPIEKSNMKKHMKMVKDNFHLPFTEISRILSSIEGSHNNPWRIVGITKNCLIRFKENDFKYKAGLGINRSHFEHRKDTHKELMEGDLLDRDGDDWFNFWWERDKTYLATSSENMRDNVDPEDIIPIDAPGLFKASGFGWRHSKQEQEYLKNLYERVMKDK